MYSSERDLLSSNKYLHFYSAPKFDAERNNLDIYRVISTSARTCYDE